MPRQRFTPEVPPTDRGPFDELYTAVYEELKRLASSVRRHESAVTLTPTALVNEVWLKLSQSPHLAQTTRAHFKGIAAYAMRQVLVEAARRRNAKKRGAGHATILVPFDDTVSDRAPATKTRDVLALDEALTDLSRLHPRQAAVVEGRFFGGLEIDELAESLHVSASTVRNDWRVARAWLHAQLAER
jgi:RNA polymerase sigma factor (TIGR02999 family)